MTTTTPASGSAARWGPLWGARPHDWAAIEEQQIPTYEEAIRCVGIEAGQRVLDIGCGSGVFLRAAADRGARVFGLDASEALLEIARSRVPDADVRLGDMQFLPHEDDFFDVVAGFNSFFFAADMVAALGEARRVAKPGARVVIQVWGRPERCDLDAMKRAVKPFTPPPPPDAPAPPALWESGVLEMIATKVGLAPQSAFETTWAYGFPDEETLVRGMLSAGGIAELVEPSRESEVRDAIVAALRPFRTESGGYRLQNEWRYVVALA